MEQQETIAKDKAHLQELIKFQLMNNGDNCDLNFIDIRNITDLSWIFSRTTFKGDISKWNTSNVKNMRF